MLVLTGVSGFLVNASDTFYVVIYETQANDNFYVSFSGGDDANNGTSILSPWQNISKVNTALGDGTINVSDNIYFKRGDTFNDDGLEVKLGGNSSDWMIIGAYGAGVKPIFSYDAGPVNDFPSIELYDVLDYLIIENIHFTTNDYHCIYCDPHNTISNVTIRNCDFDNLGQDNNSMAIFIRSGEYFKIENCVIDDAVAQGITFGGYDTHYPNNTIIRNCTITDCKDGILYHYYDSQGTSWSVGANHWIDNCTISGWIASESGIDLSGGDDFENILITNCTAYAGGGNGGVWVSQNATNVTIDNMMIRDVTKNGMGISFGTNVIIRNSIIDNWDETDDNAFLTQATVGWANNTYIYNTNFIAHAGGNIIIEFKDETEDNFIFKNNIVYSTESASPNLFVWLLSGTFESINSNWSHNMWYRGDNGSADNTWWDDSGAPVTFAQWAAESFTTGEIRTDPEFGNALADNFTLNSTSPCIDAGVWLTQTDGSGTSQWITVDDAGYFFPGLPTLGISGDNIFVGGDTNLTIIDINYNNNSIKVDSTITWANNENVSLSYYNGSAPDIGKFESKNYSSSGNFPTELILKGLTLDNNITWSGNSSTATGPVPVITFCNSSGVRNETMEINLTVNATQGIEWINVSMSNLLNTTNGWWHNASNITLWISGDNVTWQILQDDAGYGMGVFPECGANLTITDAIWGVFIGNPWTYHGDAGIIDENCSIYLRFQCNLTMGLNYGYYWNVTPCNVYIGEDTDTIDSENFSCQLQNGFEPIEGCCLDVNLTVWNGSTWVKHYEDTTVGQVVTFNLSFHNCGGVPTGNIAIFGSHYDALGYYVVGSSYVKMPGEPFIPLDPFLINWESETCEYAGHGHITWHLDLANLTNFTYCNTIYLEFNMTINNTDYSENEYGVYFCPFDFDWWDSECYNISDCYVNAEFNTSIVCPSSSPEESTWAISEHINRPCVGNGCYDEVWFDYETAFDRWCSYNASDTWEWVYRYDNLDGNGTDSLGLSYTIVNNSDVNRSMSLLRTRCNVTDCEEGTVEPCVGLIYAFTNDSNYDMVLYGWDETYLLSKRGSQLVNTNDSTVVTGKASAYNYYDSAWPKNTSVTPYHIDPETLFDPFNGIWIKTIYNEHTPHLQSKAWQINDTQPFGLDFEPPGWIINESMLNTQYQSSKCFGLIVWNPDNTTNFTADFDFIEEWRLNYSRDEQANTSQIANHPVFGTDGIPLINFPTHEYIPYQEAMWTDYNNNCYDVYEEGNMTAQQFADCTSCFYKNLSTLYSMESRQFDKAVVTSPGEEDQKDNIYYYTNVMTNLTFEAPYNNSLYIQIEECTDGTEDSYDGAVVCIDVDNDQEWDDNDMAFYWYTVGDEVWYSVYNGTTSKYYNKTSDFIPDMQIWFNAEYTNATYNWYDELSSWFPPIHRYSPHRVYNVMIPLYYLEKGSVGSGNYLNANDTFGLHIMTTDNDYEYSPVWENWNETDESYYTVNDNDADSAWTTYMNCTDWNECVDFEEGRWNGVTATQMQYWGHGKIGNELGNLTENRYEINATKEVNVSTITNLLVDNLINYTITICNTGDNIVTNVTINDTLPTNVEYVYSSLLPANVTNPSGNIYIFNVTTSLSNSDCISFNITVNFSVGCYENGTNVINNIIASTTQRANTSANNTVQYGTNKAPVITAHFPIFNRDGTTILLEGMNATVEDDNADSMDIYFFTNKTASWTGSANSIGINSTVNNGTYICNQSFNNSERFNTRWRWGITFYYWSVNVTDGKTWTNESFVYITKYSRYDITTTGDVTATDVIVTWGNRQGEETYLGLYDVDASTDITATDVTLIWSNRT